MNRCTDGILRVIATGLLTLLAASGAWSQSGKPDAVEQYPVHFMEESEALAVLQERVPEIRTLNPSYVRWMRIPPNERSTGSPRGYLLVTAPRPIQDAVAAALKQYDVPSPTLTFRIRVLAAAKTGALPADLPQAERKALQDFASVMPFRGFELLHSARIHAQEAGQAQFGDDFELLFRFEAPKDAERPVLVRSFSLLRVPRPGESTKSVLETSFSMRRGETFVLGASQVQDGGIVVLVTIES